MNYKRRDVYRLFIHALKIGVGSCIAILVAESFGIGYAATAGSVALLSTVRTKWATVKLSLIRIISFVMSMLLLVPIYHLIKEDWIAYGVFMLFLCFITYLLQWKDTLSVNAVVSTHLFTLPEINQQAIINEFSLVLIGILVALFFNQFNDYKSQRKQLLEDMRHAEETLQSILKGIADFIYRQQTDLRIWEQIRELEQYLDEAVKRAHDYQDNTYHSHPGYYIDYLEMRAKQCVILNGLQGELVKIQSMPKQSVVIADYLLYLSAFIIEHNAPEAQVAKLKGIFEVMKQEPLPVARDEFEARAILFHVLMNLEDFLGYKESFIRSLSEKQREVYWKDKTSA